MPVALPSPNFSLISKRPSPLASCSAATPPFSKRDIKVAVGGHRGMPRLAEIVGDHQGTQSSRQSEAAVIGIAGDRAGRARNRTQRMSQARQVDRRRVPSSQEHISLTATFHRWRLFRRCWHRSSERPRRSTPPRAMESITNRRRTADRYRTRNRARHVMARHSGFGRGDASAGGTGLHLNGPARP